MKASGENKETKKPDSSKKTEVVIHAKGVAKAFGDKEVLKNINFDLKRGENMVVLGKSGMGKSVTIQCIVGMLKPDAGTLTVLGENVAETITNENRLSVSEWGFV